MHTRKKYEKLIKIRSHKSFFTRAFSQCEQSQWEILYVHAVF